MIKRGLPKFVEIAQSVLTPNILDVQLTKLNNSLYGVGLPEIKSARSRRSHVHITWPSGFHFG